MTLAFFACGFQLVFITTHLPAYLQLCGVAPGVSATALGLIGLFNTIGTYIFGQLGARYSQKHLLALIYLLRTLFIVAFLLVPISATTTLIFAAAMGFAVAGRVAAGHRHHRPRVRPDALRHALRRGVPQPPGRLVLRRLDGRPGVRPHSGNYNFAWGALIVIGLAAFTLQWLMDERPPAARNAGAGLARAGAVAA